MFTGIITDIGTLNQRNGDRFDIICHYDAASIEIGASIAFNGCCLTIIECASLRNGETNIAVEVSRETLNLTTLANWQKGERINLERALKMGDEFGGHIVTGHIDGLATIDKIEQSGSSRSYTLSLPEKLKIYIAPKGSITLNGVSLTINEVDECRFGVTIIPHTYKATTWQEAREGTSMNVEVDLLARYSLRGLQVGGDLQ